MDLASYGGKVKFPAKQHEQEITEFVALLKAEGVTSYLEIGSKWGGSLHRIAEVLPPGAKIVAVDAVVTAQLQECILELRQRGFDVHMLQGDSTSSAIVARANALGPYDAVFIDGNHTMPFVSKDWENYGPMGKIVAFHDVSYVQQKGKARVDVRPFWLSIKDGYRNREINYLHENYGIGVLWR